MTLDSNRSIVSSTTFVSRKYIPSVVVLVITCTLFSGYSCSAFQSPTFVTRTTVNTRNISILLNTRKNGLQTQKISKPSFNLVDKESSSSTTLFGVAPFKQLGAILWDMDGVLADTERDGHRVAFNQAFMEYKLDTEWDVNRYGHLLEIGGGKERMTAHWNEVGWPVSMPEEERKNIVLQLHLRKTDIFMEMIQQKLIPLRPGVLRLMDDAIKNNLSLAVCSTSNELAVRNLVNTLLGSDKASRIQIFAGDIVPRKKPQPDIYNLAVQTMNLNPNDCIVIEDSYIGLTAAKAANLSCIVTKSSYTANENFQAADLVVNELGENLGVTLETLDEILVEAAAKTTTI